MTEAGRITEVYARREIAVPVEKYSRFNPDVLFREQQLERKLARILPRGIQNAQILDVGCGFGTRLVNLMRFRAKAENLWGIDVLPDRIAEARKLVPPAVHLEACSADKIDKPDSFFDLVFQFTMFSSILDFEVRQKIANEMLRVLKPGGLVISYDVCMNNPRNKDLRKLDKSEIKKLFPNSAYEFMRLTPWPPFARLFPRLSGLLPLTSHYLAKITKGAKNER
jgi:ubiquinone/menaquinone biosynthesis C-methylase UbiE